MNTSERLGVIVVSSDQHLATKLENLVHLIDAVDYIDHFNSAEQSIEKIREGDVDIAIIDVELHDINGVKLTEIIRRDFPDTQVIVISKDKDYNTMLAVMRNGASDFLTHEVTLEELSFAISRAGDMAKAAQVVSHPYAQAELEKFDKTKDEEGSSLGRIITVYSPKGGSGVTTLAINLAIALRDEETEIGLVDTSMQFGDVPILLNELPKYSVVDLVPRIHVLDPRVIESSMLFHKSSGLYILAGPSKPELADKVVGKDISQILEYMRKMFSYIVVNTSSFITDPCLAALDSGDVIVLVATQEVSAVRNARLFMGLCDGLDIRRDRIYLVLNRYNEKIKITPEQVGESVGHHIYAMIPFDEETALQAANLGVPFALQAQKTEIAKSVNSLGEKLCLELASPEVLSRKKIFASTY